MEESIRIGNMDALLFVLILEVVLLQMRILDSGALRSIQRNLLDKRKIQQRNKLSRDRIMVKDVIRQTLLEVSEEGQSRTFHQAVDVLNKSSSNYTSIQTNNDNLKTLLESTKHELIIKRHDWELQLRNFDEKVVTLKDAIKDSLLNAKAQICYAEKWMRATAEALELQYQTKSSSVPREDHEQRVHAEIVRAYELQTKEREELLEYWKIRYGQDIVKLSDHVTQQCEKLRVTTARRLELQKVYNYHAGEMRAWLTFKKERAARLAREKRSRAAATRIQAWWRGLMVRRAIGAFRHLRNSKKADVKNKKK